MYVKIITSSGFKSTILTDFVQGQLRVRFRFGRLWPMLSGSCTYLPEVVVSSAGSSTTRVARHKMEKKTQTKNKSLIYDLGVVPTRGNKSMRQREMLKQPSCTGMHHAHKIAEFDEIAQADETSFCVKLL